MKIGIIGTGAVGCACALAAVIRGSAREIVLVDRTRKKAEAVAADIRYGTPLCPKVEIADGDYDSLQGAALVMITAGINEKTGGATNRDDPRGRLRLLDQNAAIYRDIVPRITRVAPAAVLLIVTDPPDPLADVGRHRPQAERTSMLDAASGTSARLTNGFDSFTVSATKTTRTQLVGSSWRDVTGENRTQRKGERHERRLHWPRTYGQRDGSQPHQGRSHRHGL
jgi:threonine dehydrogenase-like Zn-dependent dehydrogenase